MACYNRFGWTPDAVKHLPESEALLLAVYFEEVFRLEAKQAEDMRRNSEGHGRGTGWQTDLEVGEDD